MPPPHRLSGPRCLLVVMFSPTQMDVNAEMEEVSKQLKPFSLPASAISTPAPLSASHSALPPSPLLTGQDAQMKMMEVRPVLVFHV